MATKTRRKNSITKFVQDIVDDTKELADDVLDRVRDVEENAHDAVRDIVDDEEETTSADELKELKVAIANLTKKVEKLAA
jgi:hypothetical protein